MFIFAFVKRESTQVRRHLFHTYLASLVIFLIYLIVFVTTQDLTGYIRSACNGINDVFTWNDCAEDINDLIWLFVAIYALIIIIIRGFFVRILHAWYKQAVANSGGADKTYQNLEGHNHRDSHH